MKKEQIVVGGRYEARVSGVLVTVRVEEIQAAESFGRSRKATTHYVVTNERTGRRLTFYSAAKFRREAFVRRGPVKTDSGCKVGWEWYDCERSALIRAREARKTAADRAEKGYDFGYQIPGKIEKDGDLYKVTTP